MRTLRNLLQDQDLGFLRIIAELWGFDPPRGSIRDVAIELTERMLEPQILEEIVSALPDDASEALKQSGLDVDAEVENLMNKMMQDGQIMGIIYSLLDDPDFNNILKDPDLLKAVKNGDIDMLKSNSKFMNLLRNKKIQQIKEIMGHE